MEKHTSNRLEAAAKIVLFILAGLLPIWFVPLPIGIEFGREITFIILTVIASALWLLSMLAKGELRYQQSIILYAQALCLAVLGISTFFSKAPLVSAFLADSTAEKLSTITLGIVLMILMNGLFSKKKEAGTTLLIMIFSGALAGLVNLTQIIFKVPVYQKLVSFAQGIDFNVAGTQNGLMLFYGALLIMILGLLTSRPARKWKGWVRLILTLSGIIFLANLMVVNFSNVWIVILISTVFLFGLAVKNMRQKDGFEAAGERFDWKNGGLILAVLIISVVMLLIQTPLIRSLNLPAEVSPSFRSTLEIGTKVFKEGPKAVFFGSGPGTFGLDWSKYKDISLNQTSFWGVRFNQGSSWFTTLIPTIGVLGTLTFLAFLGIMLWIFLRQILSGREEEMFLSVSLFSGFIALLSSFFLYPSNFTLTLTLFLVSGLSVFYLSSAEETEEENGLKFEENFWKMKKKILKFESPWTVFISSLLIIFLISLGVSILYFEINRARSALAFQDGLNSVNKGDLDKSLADFEEMAALDSRNFRNYQILSQARMEKIRGLIQKANQGENVQQEFQNHVSLAIQDAQKAIQLYPVEPNLWRNQGALYELIIPFIQGSERLAFSSYQKATELDPLNPAVWVELGRSALIFSERVLALENQAEQNEKAQLEKLRTTALEESGRAFNKAAEVKIDYAPAHFLLAQVALRQGNTQAAIRSAENAKLSAPFDIGVAFQLGLLYYQNNDLIRAQNEFERTLTLNQNYSNARYFLGLIYDRRGNKSKAVEQFEKVLALNPDNEEVKKILANLKKGKAALEGIAPPGTPPEKRSSTPVEEKEKEKSGSLLQKKK